MLPQPRQSRPTVIRWVGLVLGWGALHAQVLAVEEPAVVDLPPVVVTAARSPTIAAALPQTIDTLDRATLDTAPATTLDGALRASAAFSLFRRGDSRTLNPTAQGVSLRGLGPSGASRTLVLLDGIPVNDPFGGWVLWAKLPTKTLERAEIVRGGGGSAWGSAALGGTIQLLTQPPVTPARALSVSAGSHGARAATFWHSGPLNDQYALSLEGAASETDGEIAVRQPGPIDRPLDQQLYRSHATLRRALDATTTLDLAVRAYRAERGNGTPLQRNRNQELATSATLRGQGAPDKPKWALSVYSQIQDASAFFSTVSPDRAAETPTSDQYAIPARAAGLAATLTRGDLAAGGSQSAFGADLRWVSAETRDRYRWLAASQRFERDRRASGAQLFAGVFAQHLQPLSETVTLTLGARGDAWWHYAGERRERLLTSGAPVPGQDTDFATLDDFEFSPSAGLVWQAAEQLRLRASGYGAFRLPTLNEYYRGFSVNGVQTQPNPNLRAEHVRAGELAADLGDVRRGLRVGVFTHDLEDGVANVTTATDANGNASARQRSNLDRVRVRGLEAGAHWQPTGAPDWRLAADYVLSDARVRRTGADAAINVDGRRLPQVPQHTLTTSVRWRFLPAWETMLQARWQSRQFEDDDNRLPLDDALTLDLGLEWDSPAGWQARLVIENAADAENETGRTTTGVVTLGAGRRFTLSVERAW
jgi:outer membrane receptor protein involved in Fe transport